MFYRKRAIIALRIEEALANEGWAPPPPVKLGDGTRIHLYRDDHALRAAYHAIEHARHRICLETYIFRGDSTGRAFAHLLAKKARQGVRVYLIYDSFGCWDDQRWIFQEMRAAGARVSEFHPLNPWKVKSGWRPLNRDHRKLLLIDDDVAGLGGINIGAEYAGSSIIKTETCQRWRDNGVAIVGPGARLFQQAFARAWKYSQTGGPIARAAFLHGIDSGELGVLASVPTVSSPLLPFLNRLFESAAQSIDLTMAYFAPDDGLIDALCRAARRGVTIRLMLPGVCDVPFLQIAAQSFYELLLNHGVKIYQRRGAMLHAKTIVVDRRTSIIGSTNLDYRSIEFNCELSAIIRNEEFGAQMQTLFEFDVKSADLIRLEKWRYRPTLDRIVQWGVSRARYLL